MNQTQSQVVEKDYRDVAPFRHYRRAQWWREQHQRRMRNEKLIVVLYEEGLFDSTLVPRIPSPGEMRWFIRTRDGKYLRYDGTYR